ncbi:MAG: 5-bromo-4-chloroindolyl phosphate hydrolysis family protein [Pseudomonadota bacterium]
MSGANNDWRFLAGGAAGAVLLPTLVFGLGAPLWLAVVGAGAAFGGVTLLMGPRNPLDGFDPAKIGEGRAAVLRAALADVLPALERLDNASARINSAATHARVAAIAKAGRAAVAELEKAPESLSSVQRLLTYYIPQSADLAEGYAEMEARGIGRERRTAIDDLLVKLEAAFAHYRDQLADNELRALDTDIKLVGEAITEDIGAADGKDKK